MAEEAEVFHAEKVYLDLATGQEGWVWLGRFQDTWTLGLFVSEGLKPDRKRALELAAKGGTAANQPITLPSTVVNGLGSRHKSVNQLRGFRIESELTLLERQEVCLTRWQVLDTAMEEIWQVWSSRNLEGLNGALNTWLDVTGYTIVAVEEDVKEEKLITLEDDDDNEMVVGKQVIHELRPITSGARPAASPLLRPVSATSSRPTSPNPFARLGTLGMGVVRGVMGDPVANKLEESAWHLLENFSRVTNLAKTGTTHVLEHPLARPILPYIPPHVREYFVDEDVENLVGEYEGAGEYLRRFIGGFGLGASPPVQDGKLDSLIESMGDFEVLSGGSSTKRTAEPIRAEEWITWYDSSGRLTRTPEDIKRRIFEGGVEHDIRMDVWKYLVGVFEWNSTEAERERLLSDKKEEYFKIKAQWQSILTEAGPELVEEPDNGNGQAGDENEDGDVVNKIRGRKWRVEKDVVRTDRTLPYFAETDPNHNGENADGDQTSDSNAVTSTDLDIVIQRNPRLAMLRDILVTYSMYNFEIGYVQGMNDLAAPLLAIMQDESETFWTFVGIMQFGQKNLEKNFARDQTGMRTQLHRLELLIKFLDPALYLHLQRTESINLFCCFRWLLVLFKREFSVSDTLKIWESIWSCSETRAFPLFVAVAILNWKRRELMTLTAFDETLKFINELSGKLDVEECLGRAGVLVRVFRERCRDVGRDRLAVETEEGVDAQKSDVDGEWEQIKRSDARRDIPGAEMTDEEIWELVGLLDRS
ncbi:rab-GTPase-TBC domain-containing protein [Gaertneriomyces semiglobifer]|nr:rab-GTPase-TBC domain-containing protein [Gaertneriomyces semiglobifer]